MSNVDFYDGYFTFNYEHRNTQLAVILLSSLYPTHIHIYITIYIHTHTHTVNNDLHIVIHTVEQISSVLLILKDSGGIVTLLFSQESSIY